MLEKEFYRHLEDLIERNQQRDIGLHTDFLDPASQEEAEKICRKRGCRTELWGGYPEAECRALFLLGSYQEEADRRSIACIRVVSKGSFAHPDLLGALMGFGVKRGCIGDLCLQKNAAGGTEALVYAMARMAAHLAGLTSVGRQDVQADILPFEQIAELGNGDKDGEEITVSLASLRADSVLASAFSLPRSRAASLFDAGQVRLNWRDCEDKGKLLQPGDTLSVRHHGRVVLENVGGKSKKDRIFATLKVYRSK